MYILSCHYAFIIELLSLVYLVYHVYTLNLIAFITSCNVKKQMKFLVSLRFFNHIIYFILNTMHI